jgi:hypothetical protein
MIACKARLVAEHGAGAPLALEAVAHRDAHGFAFNRELELAAATGGASSGHGWLRGCELRASFGTIEGVKRRGSLDSNVR